MRLAYLAFKGLFKYELLSVDGRKGHLAHRSSISAVQASKDPSWREHPIQLHHRPIQQGLASIQLSACFQATRQ